MRVGTGGPGPLPISSAAPTNAKPGLRVGTRLGQRTKIELRHRKGLEGDQKEGVGVRRGCYLEIPHRAEAHVKVKNLSQSNVQGTDSSPDRGCEGALDPCRSGGRKGVRGVLVQTCRRVSAFAFHRHPKMLIRGWAVLLCEQRQVGRRWAVSGAVFLTALPAPCTANLDGQLGGPCHA